MDVKTFFQKFGIHFIAVGLFLIVGFAYFSPQFGGYGLKQHDTEQFKGMVNEIAHYKKATGEGSLWTNSMFGGMPSTQIHVWYKGQLIKQGIQSFIMIFPIPNGVFLLHLICFYILALCLRIKPIIGIVGAFAFAFASYEIIILQAGHNTKALAVSILPAILGGFIMTFRQNWKLGAILSAIFMSAHLSANHFQVTYYMLFLLLFLGIYFFVVSLRKNQLKKFAVSAGAIIGSYLLAIGMNYGNISMTNSYAKHTIRGGNDVTITPDGLESAIAVKGGLDREYITNWSYGIGESFTLITPYAKGSHNGFTLAETRFADLADDMDLSREERSGLIGNPNNRAYWGNQPITSGPVYLGVIVVFLALLGMFFLKDRIKWVFLGCSVFALLLSWGKNFMGLTDFFIDNIPLYDKFRTVTIIMILIELCIPVIGILLLQRFYEDREELKGQSKKFLIISGAFLVFLLGLKFVGIDNKFASDRELEAFNEEVMFQQYGSQIAKMSPEVLQKNYGVNANDPRQIEQFISAQVKPALNGFEVLKDFRKKIYNKSTSHSLLIGILGIGIVALFFFTSLPSLAIVALLGVVTVADLVVVDKNYLNDDPGLSSEYLHWMELSEKKYPVSATEADYMIMQSELDADPSLAKVLKEGEQIGKDEAEELDYSGKDRRRVIDSYKFFALNMNTSYRVFDYDGAWSNTRSSYFHKCLGGYHAAKLRNIQNVFEFHISRSNNKVMDMFNVRYLIQDGKMRKNPNALGNAWFVKDVRSYDTPNDEIRALGKEFAVKNEGNGKFLVNGDETTGRNVFGAEKMVYVSSTGDSIPVSLSNGIPFGVKVFFVMDVNGQTNLVPEMTVKNDSLNSFTKLISMELKGDFAPNKEAVMLKSEESKLSDVKFTGEGKIELRSYAPNKLMYTSEADSKQLAIFSEVYYKDGWKAYVDGKEQEILKVDYILRGLELSKGKHKIEFVYDLPAFHTASIISWTGSILIFLLLATYIYKARKKSSLVAQEIN